jgi:hypothetical protein
VVYILRLPVDFLDVVLPKGNWIILKCILRMSTGEGAWTEFIWSRIVRIGGNCEWGNKLLNIWVPKNTRNF